jgi:hypothetical protein
LDAFKITIIAAVLASIAILGAIFIITQDAINQAKIPDVQKGVVISKTVIETGGSTEYSISLDGGQILYILNSTKTGAPAEYSLSLDDGKTYNTVNSLTLYENILVNKTYQFDCFLDFKNKITIIDTAMLSPD